MGNLSFANKLLLEQCNVETSLYVVISGTLDQFSILLASIIWGKNVLKHVLIIY